MANDTPKRAGASVSSSPSTSDKSLTPPKLSTRDTYSFNGSDTNLDPHLVAVRLGLEITLPGVTNAK